MARAFTTEAHIASSELPYIVLEEVRNLGAGPVGRRTGERHKDCLHARAAERETSDCQQRRS